MGRVTTESIVDSGISERERNKHVVRTLIEEVYAGELDRLDGLVSSDYVDHSRWKDREGLRHMIAQFATVFGSRKCIVEDLFAEGDKVAARVRFELGRSPDSRGADRTVHATVIFRLAEGRVVEHWGHSDSFV